MVLLQNSFVLICNTSVEGAEKEKFVPQKVIQTLGELVKQDRGWVRLCIYVYVCMREKKGWHLDNIFLEYHKKEQNSNLKTDKDDFKTAKIFRR